MMTSHALQSLGVVAVGWCGVTLAPNYFYSKLLAACCIEARTGNGLQIMKLIILLSCCGS